MVETLLASIRSDQLTRTDICLKKDKLKLSSVANKMATATLVDDWTINEYIALRSSQLL